MIEGIKSSSKEQRGGSKREGLLTLFRSGEKRQQDRKAEKAASAALAAEAEAISKLEKARWIAGSSKDAQIAMQGKLVDLTMGVEYHSKNAEAERLRMHLVKGDSKGPIGWINRQDAIYSKRRLEYLQGDRT